MTVFQYIPQYRKIWHSSHPITPLDQNNYPLACCCPIPVSPGYASTQACVHRADAVLSVSRTFRTTNSLPGLWQPAVLWTASRLQLGCNLWVRKLRKLERIIFANKNKFILGRLQKKCIVLEIGTLILIFNELKGWDTSLGGQTHCNE